MRLRTIIVLTVGALSLPAALSAKSKTKVEDLGEALMVYRSMGGEVVRTPGLQGNLRAEVTYDLQNVRVAERMQEDGVIVYVHPAEGGPSAMAFLKTDKKPSFGEKLRGRAKFTGIKTFRSPHTGDEKQIPTFQQVR